MLGESREAEAARERRIFRHRAARWLILPSLRRFQPEVAARILDRLLIGRVAARTPLEIAVVEEFAVLRIEQAVRANTQ